MAKPQIVRKRREIVSLSDEEMISLKGACETFKEKYIIDILDNLGLRVGELINITSEDIDWQDKKITIYGKSTNPKVKGSGEKKARKIPLTNVGYERLRTFFYNEGNKKLAMTREGVIKLVRRIAKRAKIAKRVTPHVIRHTFAYRWIRKGADMGTLQLILGHEHPSTTMIYGQPNINDVASDLKKVMG